MPPTLQASVTGEYETSIPDVFNSEIKLRQVEENKKQSEDKISTLEIKKLIKSAVKKEINKERDITNSYIQENVTIAKLLVTPENSSHFV